MPALQGLLASAAHVRAAATVALLDVPVFAESKLSSESPIMVVTVFTDSVTQHNPHVSASPSQLNCNNMTLQIRLIHVTCTSGACCDEHPHIHACHTWHVSLMSSCLHGMHA